MGETMGMWSGVADQMDLFHVQIGSWVILMEKKVLYDGQSGEPWPSLMVLFNRESNWFLSRCLNNTVHQSFAEDAKDFELKCEELFKETVVKNCNRRGVPRISLKNKPLGFDIPLGESKLPQKILTQKTAETESKRQTDEHLFNPLMGIDHGEDLCPISERGRSITEDWESVEHRGLQEPSHVKVEEDESEDLICLDKEHLLDIEMEAEPLQFSVSEGDLNSSEASLKQEEEHVLQSQANGKEVARVEGKFPCRICSTNFPFSNEYLDHVTLSHTGTKPECPKCGKKMLAWCKGAYGHFAEHFEICCNQNGVQKLSCAAPIFGNE